MKEARQNNFTTLPKEPMTNGISPIHPITKYIATLSLMCIFLALSGCGGEDGDEEPGATSEFYFRFRLDGVQQNYPMVKGQINLIGSVGYDNGTDKHVINIAGIKNIHESGKETVTVFLGDSDGIPTGVNFSNFPDQGDDYPDFIFNMGYYDKEGNIYVAGGQGDSQIFTELYEPAFVKFLEITDTYIRGTFSGTLIDYETSGGINVFMGSVEITDGEFKVKRSK